MTSNEGVEVIQEQDRFLPIANVARIMKRVVPSEGKLSKESKECVQECVTEFIQFVVSEASDCCTAEKRKTITCEDLLKALGALSFEPYVDVLKTYIENFRAALKQSTDKGALDMSKVVPSTSSAEEPAPEAPQAAALEHVQLYTNPETGQYFMVTYGPNGEQILHHVTLNVDPQESA